MEKMLKNGISLQKSIAMGEYDRVYPETTRTVKGKAGQYTYGKDVPEFASQKDVPKYFTGPAVVGGVDMSYPGQMLRKHKGNLVPPTTATERKLRKRGY